MLPNKNINKTKGNEDENIVLAEIGGDEYVDNDDEIRGYESDDGIVHFTTRSERQATRLNLHKLLLINVMIFVILLFILFLIFIFFLNLYFNTLKDCNRTI